MRNRQPHARAKFGDPNPCSSSKIRGEANWYFIIRYQIWHAHVADDNASSCAKIIRKKLKERVIFYFFAENRSNFEGLCTPIPSFNFFLFCIYDGK